MSENKGFYDVYTYGDNLKPGQEITVNHSVCCENTADIANFTWLSAEKLQDMRESNIAKESAVFEKLCASVSEWEEIAAQTQLLDRALQYVCTRPVEHTSNQWSKDRYDNNEISNMVYKMSHHIREETKYDRTAQTSVPVAWYVTWDVSVIGRGQNGYGTQIAGQRQKRYTDKAAAEKYLQGRIAAYAHLFQELSPPIPKEYVQHFMVNGQLLPGYTVEGQEPKHAADISEGGISVSKSEKPSVLERLAASKAESRAVPVLPSKPQEHEH